MADRVNFIYAIHALTHLKSSSGFWVGKKSLQNWKKLKLQQINTLSSDSSLDRKLVCDEVASHSQASDDVDKSQTSEYVFNEDLLCEHGENCHKC